MKERNHVSKIERVWLRRVSLAIGCVALFAASRSLAGDNALQFTNSGQYIVPPARITTTAFTVEMWVKQFDQPTATERNFFSQYIAGNSGRLILTTQANLSGFHIGDAGRLNGVTPLSTNVWYHIAFVRDSAGTNTTYINGQLDVTLKKTVYALSATNISIGALNPAGGGNGYRGLMSDVRVWNIARTQAQIQSAKNTRLAGNEPGLQYYWKMNEGSGAVIADPVSSANGTIKNATWIYSSDLPFVSSVPIGAWDATTGGNWSDPSKWLNSTPAFGSDGYAYFTNNPPSAITVTNDSVGLKIGHIIVNGASSHTFTGQAITLTNEFASSQIATSVGAHTFETPFALTQAGVSLETLTPSSLMFTELISGPSGVSVNPAASGGGVIALSGPNTYIGFTALGSGTLVISSLADGGQPSSIGASSSAPANLRLGPGTLHYTGSAITTDRGYTLQAGSSPVRAAVLRADNDIAFGGQVVASSGALIKTGTGTVSYTFAGLNTHFAAEGGANALQNIGANGDSPTTGFTGLTITQGKVVMGVPGQTNLLPYHVDLGAYTTTNASAETAGELEVRDGVTLCPNTFSIGRHNGSSDTAGPAGLSSRLTVTGGSMLISLLAMGNDALGLPGYNAHPVCDVSGGELEVTNYLNAAEHAGALATVNVRGSGKLSLTGSNDSSLRAGLSGTAVVNLSDNGVIDATKDLRLSYNSDGTGFLNLNGGTLIARNIIKGTGTNAVVTFNGGLFMPRTEGCTLSGLTRATVSTNGARLDTSLANYTIAQNLLHDDALATTPDGGLVKLGTNTLTFASTGSTYTGPTVVSNGTLRITGSLPTGNALVVAPNGNIASAGTATQILAAESLTLDGDATLTLAFAANGVTNDRLTVASSPVLGAARIALIRADNGLPFTLNGTYTIMTYSDTDPSVGGLTLANPVFGKTYTFAASGGNLTVKIETDTAGASVWNVDAGGDWATGSNWTLAQPGTSGSAARFDDIVTAPVTVATANQTAGDLYFNSLFSYTLDGSGLILDNSGAPATISVERGAHSIAAPLTLSANTLLTVAPSSVIRLDSVSGASATLTAQGDGTLAFASAPAVQALTLDLPEVAFSNAMTLAPPVELKRTVILRPAPNTTVTLSAAVSGAGGLTQAGSCTLIPAAANTYAGPTAVNAGTLRVASLANGTSASSIGASPAAAANLLLGPGTFHYTGAAVTTDRGFTVAAGSGKAAILRAEGDITFGGPILASSGALIKNGPGTVSFAYPGPNKYVNYEGVQNALQNIGPNGDSPTTGFSGLSVTQGKVVMGVPGQTNTFNHRIDIGLRTTTAAGQETAGELEINDGVLLATSLTTSIGRNNGSTTTCLTGAMSRLTVNGGSVSLALLALGNNGNSVSGYNARPACDVNGGTLSATSINIGESAGAVAEVNVRGGTLRITATDIQLGGTAPSGQNGGRGAFTLSGTGVVEIARQITLALDAGSSGTVNLNGGTLTARNFIKGSGTEALLSFNGGLFRPSLTNQTLTGLTAATVSTNGAWFDTALADGYTVAQNLLHATSLGNAADGGLVKLGTNSLSLTGAGNTFNGRIDVRAGLLRALVGATNDLSVATGAAFDALGQRSTVGDLTGNGTLTNGIIAVTGTLDAGTNGAPAGAWMTVQNLSLVQGSTFVCTWATNALGQVTNDFVTVTGTLAPEGAGFLDLGRTEDDPIPMPFQATIMSYGAFSGSFAGWKAVNTGVSSSKQTATVVTVSDGLVTLNIKYSGTTLTIR